MERRASARRRPLPGSSSPQSTPEDRLPSPASPQVTPSVAASTPQTASRRGSKQQNNNTAITTTTTNNNNSNSFILSSPNTNRSLTGTKRRSRTMDGSVFGDEYLEDGSPVKGGHSLRKRTRVSYYNIENSTEDIEDEPVAPSSSSASARSKKRKSDMSDLPEGLQSHPPKKRGNSLGAEGFTTRRTSTRRNADAKSYQEDDDVKDTIEVGGVAISDLDEAESHPPVNGPESAKPDSQKPAASVCTSDEKTDEKTGEKTDEKTNETSDEKSDEKLDISQPSTTAGNQIAHSPQPELQAKVPIVTSFTETVVNSPLEHHSDLSSFSWPNSQSQVEETRRSPQTQQETLCHDDVAGRPADALVSETEVQQPVPTESQQSEAANAQKLEGLDAQKFEAIEAKSEAADAQNLESETAEPVVQHTEPPAEKTADEDQQILESEPSHGNALQVNAAEGERAAEPSTAIVDSSEPSSAPDVEAAADPTSDATPDAASEANQPDSRIHAQADLARISEQRSAHLTAYVDGEYQPYPLPAQSKRKGRDENSETPAQRAPGLLAKDGNDDIAANVQGSPAPDNAAATAANSPVVAAIEEHGEDGSGADEKSSLVKYRKLQNPAVYASALQNYQQMPTEELFQVLNAVNMAMQEWQTEHQILTKMLQDHDNAKRRQEADTKYEIKTRDLSVPGAHHEEPDFVIRKYGRKSKGDKENKDNRDKDRDKGAEAELRWLQSQDRIMAQSYFFAYDPHVSRIGRQNMENRNVEGAAGHQRFLRGQPKQTMKACEAGKEEMAGKRTRKPVQHFDPAPKQPSRSVTPALVKAGKKKANALAVAAVTAAVESKQKATAGKKRAASSPEEEDVPRKGPKRRRGAQNRAQDADAEEDAAAPALKTEKTGEAPKRHVLTLKVPKTKMIDGPSSAETDKDESRPSTASSESSSHTVESSYSFRPKRQKRFRDDPDEQEAEDQPAPPPPPKKRSKRAGAQAPPPPENEEPAPAATNRKVSKIKVVNKSAAGANRNGTNPAAAEAEDRPPKDYKSMTKSEKMSASMKSRWANGNMAGAVEKRKATLAAKKAAAAAGDQKPAPKTAKPKSTKEKTSAAPQQQQEQQQQGDGNPQQGNGKGKGSATFPACAPN
ncbi:hypothetical protein CP533_1140 [Ophiocordyceps camponoti-saundersi (nom. inval.)]|nr:hypothetical protein CP533_1140 [Ophiocordyceps camponoti-saundersi (nom. inval.)]